MYTLNVLHGGCRLGELCSGDIDIATPAYTRKTRTNSWGLLLGFFPPESVQNEWRSNTRPSEEEPVRVSMGIYHAGGIWPRLVFIYSEGKKPCVYYIQYWKYDIRSYRRKRPCLVSSTAYARPQMKPLFKNIFINLLPRLYRATCCNPSVHPVNLAIVSSSLHVSVI